ncbi:Tab2/Atab2 family RNA-binding protein [Candidatus Cyanaurora vandensis]|uniref:Tab2/Atab2 family RNA-binding protein n=1 Tax=Candidatus Cyanaurora vandensis TaxID=2714958 RepID=UPI0025803874|nr:Tab2/Atab2 family RNA-binding protein [Candidatus Cyanaurora vandensis]
MDTWEIDFYSRPVLDAAGKKTWELLLCSQKTDFEYVAQCSQKDANRAWLVTQLQQALTLAPLAPERVRFFRLVMAGIVEGACKQLELPCRLSLRVFRLRRWLLARERAFYPQQTGYQAPTGIDEPLIVTPQPLPAALLGEKWAFVNLQAGELAQVEAVRFGELFPVDLAPELLVPGLVIFTGRDRAMAGWMQGAEPIALRFETGRLLLEAGAGEVWVMARPRLKESEILDEGQRFEQRKLTCGGFHFLAIQASPESEEPTGFWTLWASP